MQLELRMEECVKVYQDLDLKEQQPITPMLEILMAIKSVLTQTLKTNH